MFLSAVTVRGYRAAADCDLQCQLPGRFSVLLGPNNGGKTTVAEALYLAHQHRFPQMQRASSALLGGSPREIEIEFSFGAPDEPVGSLEKWLTDQALGPPRWIRRLEKSLGRVNAARIENAVEGVDRTRLIYLPAHRNPVDELAHREAEILVELLRAEQHRQLGHRNLTSLRALAESLLSHVVQHGLVQSVETRVSRLLGSLTSGVSAHHSFVGAQVVDDAFLARVLEFLLAIVGDRADARRLELSGLGYVNLLHLAVTLAAVPGDLDSITGEVVPTHPIEDGGIEEQGTAQLADSILQAAEEAADVEEDSFFPQEGFHVTVVVEEPEAHLHPQLQHGVLRFLRRATMQRPDLQMVVTTHSGEMLAACAPEDLVILREFAAGQRVARAIRQHPLQGAKRRDTLRKVALHLDAARSAALFADKVILVEGVTDAVLLRVFARAWAGADSTRVSLIEALSIIPMGAVPGEWVADLLVTPGFELSYRVAILSDTDDRTPGAVPVAPVWTANFAPPVLVYVQSHPTLEPTLVTGNESAVARALTAINETLDVVTPGAVDDKFREEYPRSKKGWFAYELATRLSDSLDDGQSVVIPAQIVELFDALLNDPVPASDGPGDQQDALPTEGGDIGAPPAD